MKLTRRGFVLAHVRAACSVGVAAAVPGCFAEFTLGRPTADNVFDAPGGTIEILSLVVRATRLLATGAAGPAQLDVDEPGPWLIAPLTDPDMGPSPLRLDAGEWTNLSLTLQCAGTGMGPSGDPSIELIARFRPDAAGPTQDLRFRVDADVELGGTRNGLTNYPSERTIDVVDLLHPRYWFPNINVTNLDASSSGFIEFTATENPVVYAQILDALDRWSREWLAP